MSADRGATPTAVAGRRRGARLVYMAGPGDVLGSYRSSRAGIDDPSQVADTYSGQFYEVCRAVGAQALVISSHPRAERLDEPPFRIEHRPLGLEGARGIRYHLGEIAYDLRLIASCLRNRADLLLLQGGHKYWFLFAALHPFGVRVIPLLMVVFQSKRATPSRYERLLGRLNGWFFRRVAQAILSASDEISRQVVELSGGSSAPIVVFFPRFRGDRLPALNAPSRPPFRVLFAGRIEENKGVFDLVEIARTLRGRGRTDVEFDLCGTGTALAELRRRVDAAGLSTGFRLHGHCDHFAMAQMYGKAHAVVVPTTSDFVEGFNQVVIEGVLSARPVVTSAVCPSLEYVREAALEVPPDEIEAYASAIVALADDPQLYRQKQQACLKLRGEFLDTDRDFATVLARVLSEALGPATPGKRIDAVVSVPAGGGREPPASPVLSPDVYTQAKL